MNMVKTIITLLFCMSVISVSAQNYSHKVSRDSVAALKLRVEILKASVKMHELKLTEAEQEADIEKQELKVLDLQGIEKSTTDESDKVSGELKNGKETDIKKVEKLSRKAVNSSRNLENATERLRKLHEKVEDTRSDIKTEELRLESRKLVVYFRRT